MKKNFAKRLQQLFQSLNFWFDVYVNKHLLLGGVFFVYMGGCFCIYVYGDNYEGFK